jgi:adenine-specific DNA-methyltransferase
VNAPLHTGLSPDPRRKGQVFTPSFVVSRMLALRQNYGRVLEPACGDGAFLKEVPDAVALEIDPVIAPRTATVMDFFAYPETEKFDTIIGNPPYVRSRDILPETTARLTSRLLDGHANLYLHFIEKCVRHLKPGGELIFITPREFLKSTGARRLNVWLFSEGTITDLIELGDQRVFHEATPNCVIWRFERSNHLHHTHDGRRMLLADGQILVARGDYTVRASDIFSVRVGSASGADAVFEHATLGDTDFVCSHTRKTAQTRRMIFNAADNTSAPDALAWLQQHKARLLERKVRPFDESNWWQWGRVHAATNEPRIYVNMRTREQQPFYQHACRHWDGTVLALFPHKRDADMTKLTAMLNSVDWHELGFVCDGRFLFAQRSLEQTLLPEGFLEFAVSGVV